MKLLFSVNTIYNCEKFEQDTQSLDLKKGLCVLIDYKYIYYL